MALPERQLDHALDVGPALHVANEALFIDPSLQALDGELMKYLLSRELQTRRALVHFPVVPLSSTGPPTDGEVYTRCRATAPAPTPPATAGYSGTPLLRKLGVKPRMRVVLVKPPDGFTAILEPLPPNVTLRTMNRGARDITLWCTRSRRELERGMTRMVEVAGDGQLWISWPKKTSPLAADHTGDDVRRVGLAAGLVDFKVCAVDEDWSGLAFVRRRR